jgi:hypothetical protein
MPAPKRYWPGRCEFPLTKEYERGHVETFGEKAERYCEGCGVLRVWCKCPLGQPTSLPHDRPTVDP